MDADVIIRKLRDQRAFEVTVEPAKGDEPAVVFNVQRPPMGDWDKFTQQSADGKRAMVCTWQLAAPYVVGWKITEAQILGSEQAPGDPVDFSRELFEMVISDRADWSRRLGEGIIDAILAAYAKRKAAEGNSSPT